MDPTRTTLDIIWSCLATLVACVWVALHPNIVSVARGSLLGRIFTKIQKPHLAFMALLTPEAALGWAIYDWLRVRESLRDLKRLWEKNKVKSKQSNSTDNVPLLPVMNDSSQAHYDPTTNDPDKVFNKEWTATHAMFLHMDGFVLVVNGKDVGFSGNGLGDILFLAWRRHISLNDLQDRIEDRSNADWIKKTLACLQIGWFVSQCIGRAVQKFAITELEITVVGYVILALLQYGFWWHKPQDVQTKVRIIISEESFRELEEFRQNTKDDADIKALTDTPYDNIHGGLAAVLGALSGVVFGAVHCIAWNFDFPTEKERMLWRICSSFVTALPPTSAVLAYAHDQARREVVKTLVGALVALIMLGYVVARMALLVEVFLCLRSMPDDVHKAVRWTTFFPHI